MTRPRRGVGPRAGLVPTAAVLVPLLLSCQASPPPPVTPPTSPEPAAGPAAAGVKGSGTRRMAELLDRMVRNLDPTTYMFANTLRADYLHALLERNAKPRERASIAFSLADQLLKAGKTEEAIAVATPLLQADPNALGAPDPIQVREFLAFCQMRLGEQRNCIMHRGVDSCLLPIKGSGIHTDQRGSRAAIKGYTEILETNPKDLSSRWLLNIASMTVGEYPGKVPARWLIPPKVFAPEYDIKRFYDVAVAAGVAVRGLAGGSVMDDFDGDGELDIVASSMGLRDPLRFFHNNGDGTFSERSEAAGLTGEIGGLNIVHADYDNDGFPDLLVLRGGWGQRGGRFPNSLLKNNGDGTFDDVTQQAGILSFHPTQTAAWADYDGDGWLDLFIGNESMKGDEHPCELYHNSRDGTFTNRTADIGATDLGYVKGVAWGDFNNDGRPDLYVSILNGDNALFRNDGPRDGPGPAGEDWRFTNVSREAGTIEPRHSFPTWFWDYDNDGWQDIFVGGYQLTGPGDVAAMYLGLESGTALPKLYRNRHDGTFADVTHEARLDRLALPMGSNFGDLDNDGWLDCYFGTGEPQLRTLIPNRMFRNAAGAFFQDVTSSGGFGHLQKGHGIAFGDLDNDGDQDIYQVIGGAFEGDVGQNALFRNPGHGGHWITLRLEGRRSNRSAIGARLKVTVRTPRGGRDIYATVGSGGSFGGSSLQQEIGLGDASRIEAIEVTWPATGVVQTFRDAKLDRFYRILEGEPTLTPVTIRRFDLGGAR
jgi:FG-GAP-like repeat/ASPIC and UnbV